MTDRIRLLELREEPLSVEEVYAAVEDPAAGGIAVFVGAVRDHADGRQVRSLAYSAHPSARHRLHEVAEQVIDGYPVRSLALVHRVGTLAVGELAVVAAVGCAHRAEAFDACRALVDGLKAGVPIWKHERFADGTEQWVGAP